MTEENFRGYFPGSKVPLPDEPPTPRRRAPLVTGWDTQPVFKTLGGIEYEFFNIGAVCQALGRPPVTIRLWIRKGYMPHAPFRMPPRGDVKGRRMWKREHIEILITVAHRHGLLDSSRVDWSQHRSFAQEVKDAWDALSKEETED